MLHRNRNGSFPVGQHGDRTDGTFRKVERGGAERLACGALPEDWGGHAGAVVEELGEIGQ